jgi:hypothetical protein
MSCFAALDPGTGGAYPGLPSPRLGTIFRCTKSDSMNALDASHVPVELSEKHHVQGYGGQSQGSMLCVYTGAVVPK